MEYTKEELLSLSKKDLLTIIKDKGLKGNNQNNKEELVDTIVEASINFDEPTVEDTDIDPIEEVIVTKKEVELVKPELSLEDTAIVSRFKLCHELFREIKDKKIVSSGIIRREQSFTLSMARHNFLIAMTTYLKDKFSDLGAEGAFQKLLNGFEMPVVEKSIYSLEKQIESLKFEVKRSCGDSNTFENKIGNKVLLSLNECLTCLSIKTEELDV